MSFLYSILLKLFYPTSISLGLLLASAVFSRPQVVRRILFWSGIGVIFICGNGWLIGAATRNLERRYLAPDPLPSADCILILSGGIAARIPPRATVEVGEAGDRLLYGAHLYRLGRATNIICTGGVATGGVSPRSLSEEMAEFLSLLSIPQQDIVLESQSSNTREHALNLSPLFQKRGLKRILLVTSAMHMPRSIGTFRYQCPGIEFIPAPTDFRVTDGIPVPWYRHLIAVIPTPSHLLNFSEVMHEYLGIAYYKLRGWM